MSLILPSVTSPQADWPTEAPSCENIYPLKAARQKPRVLFITPTSPLLSGQGGAMRAGMNIMALAEIFEVHILLLSRFGSKTDLPDEPELVARMASITVVNVLAPAPHQGRSGPSNLDVLKRLVTRPRSALRFPKQDIDAVLKPFSGQKFDLVFFSRLATGTLMDSPAFRRWIGKTPRILDIDDIESETARREARVIGRRKGRIGHLADLLDTVKLGSIEKVLFKRFNEVLVCSRGDRAKMMQRHPNINFGMLPNGFRVPAERPQQVEPDVPTLLFVGSLQYPPNEEGILSFCADVLPRLRQMLGRPFRLLVVGRNPPKKLLELERIPEVSIQANVPDVAPYYRSATMAIVPINFGGGTRIKILEAMALGCPVISTSLGAEGIEASDGQSILLADGAQALADACLRLVQDPALRENLVQSGWDVVSNLYSVEAVTYHMADCIKAASDILQQLV